MTRSVISTTFALFGVAVGQAVYQYEQRWFPQYIDHFSYNGANSASTFQNRYLINDTWWAGPTSPIMFYTGNEGDIELFAQNTGHLWEFAETVGALVIFCEHRYYGQTMPFGDASYNTSNLAFLSSEQALMDFVDVIASLKANYSAPDAPVIAWGGSYGGMLTAWLRMKYPGTVVGGLAASAPILQWTNVTPPEAFMAVVTHTWGTANPVAPQAIFNSWGVLAGLAATQTGRDSIRSLMRICDALDSPDDVTGDVYNWLNNAIVSMTEVDYPSAANFLGPMPAWPVNVSAGAFTDANAPPAVLLPQLAVTANVFYNSSGQAGSCFNLSALNPPGLGVSGWGYQSCTEMVMPIGQYGLPSDMFWVAPWDLGEAVVGCQQQYAGTTPRPFSAALAYGSRAALPAASNLILSNGRLDPWSSGGVTAPVPGAPASVLVLFIDESAHHLDLRASDPSDPAPVVAARSAEDQAMLGWLREHYEGRGVAVPAGVARAATRMR